MYALGERTQRNPNTFASTNDATLKPSTVSVPNDMAFGDELKALGREPVVVVSNRLRIRKTGELSSLVLRANGRVQRKTWDTVDECFLVAQYEDRLTSREGEQPCRVVERRTIQIGQARDAIDVGPHTAR